VRIVTPRIGARCFDHFGGITLAQAQALAADGFEGCFGYVATMTAASLQVILDAGMWWGALLEGLADTTEPTRELGQRMASTASAKLRDLMVPRGMTVFADLENDKAAFPAADWYAFAAGAGLTTIGSGDIAGIYIAEGTGLTRDELSKLPATRYFRGAARVVDRNGVPVDEPTRGWCVLQGPIDQPHPSGVQIDYDVAWPDRLGSSVAVVSA
jgi:hypothetical protein